MASIESRLRQAVRDGAEVDLSPHLSSLGPDTTDEEWAGAPVVDAAFLLSLITDGNGVHPRGLSVRGARIAGDLDWSWRRFAVPLSLTECRMDAAWVLHGAMIPALLLHRCRVQHLNGRLLIADGDLRFTETHFLGTVGLADARLRGSLILHGSTLATDMTWQGIPVALLADRLTVGGNLAFTRGFRANALLSLRSASVGGSLFSGDARVRNGTDLAIDLSGSVVSGDVQLNGLNAEGAVQLDAMTVGRNVGLDGARLVTARGEALSFDQARISGSILMRDAEVNGRVRMLHTRVSGNVSMERTVLSNPKGQDALWASNLEVEGNLFLRNGFTARGGTRLISARVGRSVDLSSSTLEAGVGYALGARNSRISGEVNLRDLAAIGTVSFAGAKVEGSMLVQGASFSIGSGAPAFQLSGATIDGSVALDGATVAGQLRLTRVTVGGDMVLSDVLVQPSSGIADQGTAQDPEQSAVPGVTLAGSRIGARLRLRRTEVRGMAVDLGGASVRELDDDRDSWPHGGLVLSNFTFDGIGRNSPRSARDRIDWVRRQAFFSPDPYRRLITIYREAGQSDEATEVAIAQQDDLLAASDLRLIERWWRRFLGWSVRHGYRPGRAAAALAVVYLLTVAGVAFGVSRDAFIQVGNTAPQPDVRVSRCDDRYPCLSVPVYALENIVPFVSFHQSENWQPDASTPSGEVLRGWLFLTTVAGYLGSTLLAAAATGLIESKLST